MMREVKRISLLILISLLWIGSVVSANPEKITIQFTEKDSIQLFMDIYRSDVNRQTPSPCIIFLFGGGFVHGDRNAEEYVDFFNHMAKQGYVVASIDYRVGLKGKKGPTLFNREPLVTAINMAVEDLYSATDYLIKNADTYNIDTNIMIISGSSAGAITVLQADYYKRNGRHSVLSDDFQYAGVISYAGAIYSTEGTPSYKIAPAPTLFFHGSADKLVPYKGKRLFNVGMFGSKKMAAKFKKSGYPYCFFSMHGIGHSVSEYPMKEYLLETDRFIQSYVLEGKQWFEDINHFDKNREKGDSRSPSEYYN